MAKKEKKLEKAPTPKAQKPTKEEEDIALGMYTNIASGMTMKGSRAEMAGITPTNMQKIAMLRMMQDDEEPSRE